METVRAYALHAAAPTGGFRLVGLADVLHNVSLKKGSNASGDQQYVESPSVLPCRYEQKISGSLVTYQIAGS